MFLGFFSLLVQARVRLFPENVLEPETKRESSNVKKCIIRHCREQKNKHKNDKRSTFVSLVSGILRDFHGKLFYNSFYKMTYAFFFFFAFFKIEKKIRFHRKKNKFIIRICWNYRRKVNFSLKPYGDGSTPASISIEATTSFIWWRRSDRMSSLFPLWRCCSCFAPSTEVQQPRGSWDVLQDCVLKLWALLP